MACDSNSTGSLQAVLTTLTPQASASSCRTSGCCPAPPLMTIFSLSIPHSEAVKLAAGLHVVPEFLGNRAPLADPHAKALIAGLGTAAGWKLSSWSIAAPAALCPPSISQ
jgi:ribulose kinase